MKKCILIFLGLLFFSSCSTSKTRVGSHTSSQNYSDGSNSKTILKKRNNSLEDYASLMGVKTSELTHPELYLYIDQWLGTPHKMGGLSKSGVDCSAFVGEVYRNVYHESLPRTSRDMATNTKEKSKKKLREGDLLFFSFGNKNIDHVGIYLQNNKFLHVSTKKGVIISDLTDSWYAKYFVKAGSLR